MTFPAESLLSTLIGIWLSLISFINSLLEYFASFAIEKDFCPEDADFWDPLVRDDFGLLADGFLDEGLLADFNSLSGN
jgi:hypothetical protein